MLGLWAHTAMPGFEVMWFLGIQTQVLRLLEQALLPTESSPWPWNTFKIRLTCVSVETFSKVQTSVAMLFHPLALLVSSVCLCLVLP